MGLTKIPTKTADSIGAVVRDRPRPLPRDPRYAQSAEEHERLKDTVIELAAAVGLEDGSTSGSLEERVGLLETGGGAGTLTTLDPEAAGDTAEVNQNISAGDTVLQNITSPAGEPEDASAPYYLLLDDGDALSEHVVVIGRSGAQRTLAAPTQHGYSAGPSTIAYAGPATTPAAAGLMPASELHRLEAMETGAQRTSPARVADAGAVMDGDFDGVHAGTMARLGAGLYQVRRDTYDATAAPAVGDDDADGYAAGSIWVWPDHGIWICEDASTGAAEWRRLVGTTVREESGTEYAPTQADDGAVIVCTNGVGCGVPVPNGLPIGFALTIVARGGVVDFDAPGDVAFVEIAGQQDPPRITRFGGVAVLRIVDTDVAYVSGADLETRGPDGPVTGTRTLSRDDHEQTIKLDSSGGSFDLDLPTPSDVPVGFWCRIVDVGGALSTNPVTLDRAGGESINGAAADYLLRVGLGEWVLRRDGSNWLLRGDTARIPAPPIVDTNTTRTISQADNEQTIWCLGSEMTVTVPAGLLPNTIVQFVRGEGCAFVVVEADTGVVLRFDAATFDPAAAATHTTIFVQILGDGGSFENEVALVFGDLAPASEDS